MAACYVPATFAPDAQRTCSLRTIVHHTCWVFIINLLRLMLCCLRKRDMPCYAAEMMTRRVSLPIRFFNLHSPLLPAGGRSGRFDWPRFRGRRGTRHPGRSGHKREWPSPQGANRRLGQSSTNMICSGGDLVRDQTPCLLNFSLRPRFAAGCAPMTLPRITNGGHKSTPGAHNRSACRKSGG